MRPRAAIPGSLRPLLLQRRPPLGRRSRGIGRDVVLLAQPRRDAAYAVDDPQTATQGLQCRAALRCRRPDARQARE